MDKSLFITSINNNIDKNVDGGIWKNLLELEEITGFGVKEIISEINKIPEIKQNSKNEYTTQYLYHKYTSFFNKFLDASVGFIR